MGLRVLWCRPCGSGRDFLLRWRVAWQPPWYGIRDVGGTLRRMYSHDCRKSREWFAEAERRPRGLQVCCFPDSSAGFMDFRPPAKEQKRPRYCEKRKLRAVSLRENPQPYGGTNTQRRGKEPVGPRNAKSIGV